ncbi:MAG: DUF4388 domain-containing protein [Nitrospirae bacterium]|nr:DUF4388 domain-containing protein [Nitrospirota bacterium]
MAEVLDKRYKRLKDFKFPEILLSLGVAKKTGILHMKNWPAEKLIYVKNGNIFFASSNIEEDCLGIRLLTMGKITVTQYYESIRLLEKTGKRHGSVLVELGYLSQKELENAIKNQIEDIVFGIFGWEDGYFFFEEIPFNADEVVTLEEDTVSLIFNGIKRMDSFPQIRNAIPFSTILTLSPGSQKIFKKIKFDAVEQKIIGMVDGKKTVLDIISNFQGNDLETLKFLYALNSIEAAVPVNYTDTDKAAILEAISETSPEGLYKKGTELFMNGKYRESIGVFKEAVNLSPGKASYHFYLAMSFVNTSMVEDAEKSLIKAIEIEPFNDEYYAELGMVYTKRGLTQKAVKTFKFALRINPHNERARNALSDLLGTKDY